MQTGDIERTLSKDTRTRGSFRGVFPSDKLPSNPNYGTYVINFDPSGDPGTHWVAVNIHKSRNKAEYFDSYGFPPFVQDIITFLQPFTVKSNRIRLQNFESDLCGEYCCLYALFKCTKGVISQFTSLFPNPELNDCEVVRLFSEEFGSARRQRKCHPRSQKCCALLEKKSMLKRANPARKILLRNKSTYK